jgi:hypothetical protein
MDFLLQVFDGICIVSWLTRERASRRKSQNIGGKIQQWVIFKSDMILKAIIIFLSLISVGEGIRSRTVGRLYLLISSNLGLLTVVIFPRYIVRM